MLVRGRRGAASEHHPKGPGVQPALLKQRRESMRSPHLIGVLFVLAGAGLLSAAPRVRAADTGYVKLIQVDSGKALGVADDSDEAGARAVLAKDGDGKGLQWKLEKDG